VLENAKMKVDKMKDTSMAVEAVTEMALNSRRWSAAGARAERRARGTAGGVAALRRSGEGGRRVALRRWRRWRRGDRGRAGGGAKRKCETSEREKVG
jgi:hypothetical protein